MWFIGVHCPHSLLHHKTHFWNECKIQQRFAIWIYFCWWLNNRVIHALWCDAIHSEHFEISIGTSLLLVVIYSSAHSTKLSPICIPILTEEWREFHSFRLLSRTSQTVTISISNAAAGYSLSHVQVWPPAWVIVCYWATAQVIRNSERARSQCRFVWARQCFSSITSTKKMLCINSIPLHCLFFCCS